MKTLYHGTNTDIEAIDLHKGLQYKDFGQGFYLTDNLDTAKRMALKKAHLFGGEPTLITYAFDDSNSQSLKTKVFPEQATIEWIKFVHDNRSRKNSIAKHDYDIVIGPIADDGVVLQLTSYEMGLISAADAAKRLQNKHLDQQYYFGTTKALSLLTKQNAEAL